MNWQSKYQEKIVCAEDAITRIKDGDQVVISQGAAMPLHLLDTLAAHKDRFHNVGVFNILNLADMPLGRPEMEGHFRCNTIFTTGTNRAAINSGRYDYTPAHFSHVPGMVGKQIGADVAILVMSPPDEEGYFTLGLSADYGVRAAQVAKVVIAEVNEQMPYLHGGVRVHSDDIDCIVPVDYALPEMPLPTITAIEEAIGRHCASLVRDGDTLQLGIGAIPEAVLTMLKDKRDLGLHSEMLSDGVIDLIESGVINGSKKTYDAGKHVVTFLMGSRRLYDYVHNNPSISMQPVDYTNHPVNIMRQDNMVSINSCLQVDLTGQINAECLGTKQYSGIGGQGDFVRGAGMSRGGRSIIAIPSTSKGKYSRIVPILPEGTTVTTMRYDVQYVVTEYGIADLYGRTLRERARALIAIAHPDFRAPLIEEYRARFGEDYPQEA